MISLNDKSSLFSQHREKYIENKLHMLKEKDSINKNNSSKKRPNLNIVGLGKTIKISLNLSKENSAHNNHKNRLRCTWLIFNNQVEGLIDTGASHTFISRTILSEIPKEFIVKTSKYRSSMITAAGDIKNNISAKVIINTSFCTSHGDHLEIPIEFLVAEKLNNWGIILGENFLGNHQLKINISSEKLNLTWKGSKFDILLYYSKPAEALGYLLCAENTHLEPKEKKLVKIKSTLSATNETIITENDYLIKKNFVIDNAIINVNNEYFHLLIENDTQDNLYLHKNMNVGLAYEIQNSNNEISVDNLFNILKYKPCNHEKNMDPTIVNNYNSILYNVFESTEYLDFESHVADVTSKIPCHFPEDASDHFQDNLDLLPDTFEQVESWSYKDVDIAHLEHSQQKDILKLLENFDDVFAKNRHDVGVTSLMEANIRVNKKHKSFRSQKQRFMEPSKLKVAIEAADVLLKSGVIRISESPVLKSNLCLVPRVTAGNIRDGSIAAKINSRFRDSKPEESWRVCVDLRNLNDCAIGVSAPALLSLDHILDKLKDKIISNVDLSNGYHHIRLSAKSCPLTAFYLGDKILEYCRLTMGYNDAPRQFVIFMQKIFSQSAFEECWKTLNEQEQGLLVHTKNFADLIISYMDDLWMFSDPKQGLKGHLPVIKMTLTALRLAGVLLGPKKCTFFTYDFKVLGVNVNTKKSELYLNEKKANAIMLWTRPNSLSELQSRIFSLNYWEKFIPRLRDIISPWFLMLRDKVFNWDSECEAAFHQLKAILVADIRLAIPQRDSQLIMTTDASKISTSQILFIRDKNGRLRICGCNSRIFSPNDSRRDANYKEAISLACGFKAFGAYLSMSDKPPIILCDARNLIFISRMKERSILAQNLSSFLYDMAKLYQFQIFMIPGHLNYMADIFSRAFSNSKYVCKDKYNLSKETAENLPRLNIPFEIDNNVLQLYLKSEILPDSKDTGNRNKNLPKNIEPLLQLYLDRTPEERFCDAMILLKQISRKMGKSKVMNLIKAEGLPTDYNLTEEEIKNLINYDECDTSDIKKVRFLKPLIERIVDTHFGPKVDSKHKNMIRNALMLNYMKMRNLKFNEQESKQLNNNIIREINDLIKSEMYNKPNQVTIDPTKKSNSHDLSNVLSDDGECLQINFLADKQDIWEYGFFNNIIFQDEDDIQEEDNIPDSSTLESKCKLNNNLLHTNVDKLDEILINSNGVVKVIKKAVKQNIYYTCDGLFPPLASPYGFDAGIDLSLQEKICFKPGKEYKVNTQLSFLLNSTTCGIIYPKSRFMGRLEIFPGVIDSNYTGKIIIGVKNISLNDITFEPGQSFAQMVISEINLPHLIRCDKLIYSQENSIRQRGDQGFGSSNNIKLNLLELQQPSFLQTIGLKVNKPITVLSTIKVTDIFSDSIGALSETSVPAIGEGPNVLDHKDQLNSWRYLRGQVMSKTVEERQNIIKNYLGIQTIKQAMLYTDIMANENFDSDCLSRLQRSDEYFGTIYNNLSDNKNQPRYQIIKKLLYKIYNEKLVLCIPSVLLIGLIRIIHEKLLHGSKNQTWNTFQKYFTHPLGKTFISKFIKACLTCRCTTIPMTNGKNLILERSYEPTAAREVLSFDLIPNLPSSETRTAILIIVDDFSGYLIIVGLKSIESKKIEDALYNVFSTIGFPKIARSDCDRRIVNALNNLQSKIPFILNTSSPYLHNQNGKAEQGVKMFKDMARKVIFDPNKNLHKSDWFKLLPIIAKTINNLTLTNSKVTREELFFKSSSNNIFNMIGAEKIFEYIESNDQLIDKYEKIIKEKREMDKNKNKSKIIPNRILLGDIVVFLNETVQAPGLSKAFRPNGYLNLFQVIKKDKHSSTLEIQSLRTGQINTTDIRKVRKIEVSEFISELQAENYFRNIPDFSKFTKPGIIKIEEPLFDCKDNIDSKKDQTNLTELKKIILQDEGQTTSDQMTPEAISEPQAESSGITNFKSKITNQYDPQILVHHDVSNKTLPIIDENVITDQLIDLIPIKSYGDEIPKMKPSLESHKKSKPKLIPLSGKKKKDAQLPDGNRTLNLRTRQVRFKNI